MNQIDVVRVSQDIVYEIVCRLRAENKTLRDELDSLDCGEYPDGLTVSLQAIVAHHLNNALPKRVGPRRDRSGDFAPAL